MEIQSFNAELAIANLMFKKIFNNISIEHTLSSGEKKQIKVNCVFGQRSRILKSHENPELKGNFKLPMIAINRTGYARNGERLNNLHNEVKYEESGKKRNYNLLTPIPIDISYDVCIMSKTPSDIDQIASNFMVFFNSDIYVSCVHPKYEGVVLNNQIIMSDSISEEHPDELDSTADDFITATFQFTFKTYLFGGNQQAKRTPKYILSTCISTYIKSELHTVTLRNISSELSALIQNPDQQLTVQLTSEETGEVTAYVPSQEISDQIYDGFTPIIQKLDVGFYAIPRICSDYNAAMTDIDNKPDSWTEVDKLYWRIDETSPNVFPYNVYPYRKDSLQ